MTSMHGNAGIVRERIVTEAEYRLFRKLLEQRFGILLKNGRMLTSHMKVFQGLAVLGIETYRQYYVHFASDPEGIELALLLSHLAGHETCFFAEVSDKTFVTESFIFCKDWCAVKPQYLKNSDSRLVQAGSGATWAMQRQAA